MSKATLFRSDNSSRFSRMMLITLLTLCIAVLGIAVGGATSSEGPPSSKGQLPSSSSERQPTAQDELSIQLNGNGFNPSEVQHAAGTFAIAVENSTLSGEYTLRLKAEDGTVLKEVQVQKGSSAWTVNLQTGRYTLTEVDHSEWICTIVVQ